MLLPNNGTSSLGNGRVSADPGRAGEKQRLRILTWHVHGNYLYYLTQTPHEFYLPVGRDAPGYAGCAPGFSWPANVHDVPVENVRDLDLHCILFQSKRHYLEDQYEILSDA